MKSDLEKLKKDIIKSVLKDIDFEKVKKDIIKQAKKEILEELREKENKNIIC
jgi:hypothetical protein